MTDKTANSPPLAEVNPFLSEKFGRRSAFKEPSSSEQPAASIQMKLNTQIRRYVKAQHSSPTLSWTDLPEFPDAEEIFESDRKTSVVSKDHGQGTHNLVAETRKPPEPVEIDSNTIVGPYSSKHDYLSRHYSLLREDAVSPLRDVISEVQKHNFLLEKDSKNDAHLYERVCTFELW